MGLVVGRRDGVDVPAGRHGLGGPAVLRALAPALLRLPPDPVHPPHGGGAAVAARAVVERLEFVEAGAPDAGTLGEQRGEGFGASAEGSRLLQQRRMTVEGRPVGIAQRDRVAFVAGPCAELLPRRKDLLPAGGESVDAAAVPPDDGGTPDVPRDPGERVVVRSRKPRLGRPFVPCDGGAAPRLPGLDVLLPLLPIVVGRVVERGLLGTRARPALRQPSPDLAVQDRRLAVAVRPPVGHVQRQRRAVDIDADLLAVARRRRVDRLPCRPVVGQQEGAVHRQPLCRGDGERIAVIETDVAVPVADLVMAEGHPAPVVGARRDEDGGLLPCRLAGLPEPLLAASPPDGPPFPPRDLQVLHLDAFDGDDGAVEELLLPVGRADAQAVADGDLQRRRRPVVLGPAAHGDRDALDVGALFPGAGEAALPYQMRESPRFGPRARQHHACLVGMPFGVAIPVVHEGGERPLLVVVETEPSALVPGFDGFCRLAVPQSLRRRNLPGREHGFSFHRLVVREDAGALVVPHQTRPEPRGLRRLPVHMDEDVFQIGFLAPDTVHADAAHRVPDQPQSRTGLHRLLLPGVAREHHLRLMTLREPQDVMGLPGRQHPRLVHDDRGLAVDLDPVPCRQLQELVHAVGTRVHVVAERHGRPPCHGGGDDGPAMLAAEIGDGPERGGLAGARRTLDDRHASLRASHRADRCHLLPAQRIALRQQPRHLLLDRLRRQPVAGLGGHAGRCLAHRLLHLQRASRGVEPGMRHVGPALGRAGDAGEPHHLGAAEHPLDGGRHRLPAQQAGGGVAHTLDDIRQAEHRLFPG